MNRRHYVWESNEFTGLVRTTLPTISGWLQITAHFIPPDGEGQKDLLQWYYQPVSEKEAQWQVDFAFLPQLHWWRDKVADAGIKQRRRNEELSPEELTKIWKGESKWSQRDIDQVFAFAIAIALIAPAISHAHLALFSLQKSEWGKVFNAASSLGLLYLGETIDDLDSLSYCLGHEEIPYMWHSQYWLESQKAGRLFDPGQIPLSVWKGILQTLAERSNVHPRLTETLLRWAWENEAQPLANQFLFLGWQLRQHTVFVLGGLLDYFELGRVSRDNERILTIFREALSQENLLENNTSLADAIRRCLRAANSN